MQLDRLPFVFQIVFSNNFRKLSQFCDAVQFIVADSLPHEGTGNHLTASLKACVARIIFL